MLIIAFNHHLHQIALSLHFILFLQDYLIQKLINLLVNFIKVLCYYIIRYFIIFRFIMEYIIINSFIMVIINYINSNIILIMEHM